MSEPIEPEDLAVLMACITELGQRSKRLAEKIRDSHVYPLVKDETDSVLYALEALEDADWFAEAML